MIKIALVGDSFTDKYIFGEVHRLSPESPVPLLDVSREEIRGGGALDVANSLHGLGINFTLFTITELLDQSYEIVSPKRSVPLVKTRFVTENHHLLRVDSPNVYQQKDLNRMRYPKKEDWDIIVFIDYLKGIIKEGVATLVDTKKQDLSVFKGSRYLKVNQKEWENAFNKDFPEAFVTRGKYGIDYYSNGKFMMNLRNTAKEVIDVTGAGDVVMATIIYCLAHNINNPGDMMRLANTAAGISISKFGTPIVTLKELNAELKKSHQKVGNGDMDLKQPKSSVLRKTPVVEERLSKFSSLS
ncbi:hypothetical protein KAW50_02660 [candidate division WOR-3 bacterium]|nr:hypothetical protein [candidate division WOR-3 bacterium]